MANFKINNLRYNWKGIWVSGTAYNRDDIVRYGASSYVCIVQHTADTDFNDDISYVAPGASEATPRWVKMTDGFIFREDWQTGTLYNVGDVILFGGTLYLCNTAHTSSVFADDISNWTTYVELYNWTKDWAESTTYGRGDIVKYNGIVYQCLTSHDSQSATDGLEADSAKWEVVHEGIEYKGDWTVSTLYRDNDLVKYGATIFRCNTLHTSTSTFDDAKFDVEFYGFQFDGEWNASTVYNIGDIVREGGFAFYCKVNNVNKLPSDSQLGDTTYWTLLARANNLRGDWDPASIYKPGDLVRRGGRLWRALNLTSTDGSSLDYLDDSAWELITPSQNWTNFWAQGNTYKLGDIALFDGSIWECTVEHIADTQNYPGDNGSGYDYWNLVVLAGEGTGLSAGGDLLTYNLSRRFAGDGSTFDVTNVPIGNSDEVASINSEDTVFYKNWGDVQQFIYVDPNGIDDRADPERGINPFKPYKSVRYACERIEREEYTGESTIYIQPGKYEEILPIVVPPRTALRGSEVRSVIIKPNQPLTSTKISTADYISLISHLSGKLPGILTSVIVAKSTGNNETQVTSESVGDQDAIDRCQNNISDVAKYINFYVNSTGTDVSITGTNSETELDNYINARNLLEANRNFLIAEGLAFLPINNGSISFDTQDVTNDINSLIDGLKYDLRYIGNYRTIRVAEAYSNALLGSESRDMFYVRDATGIRNLTVDGLVGTLAPPSIFDLYQRPVGGSYVSLDPGWGPNDEKVWITTRSCYVQNVTTFGYAVTGQKIDGALHNGGNKSIVSNDFTQVISDGIGAHVLNNGRAELVSVFTYYAQVGYLAEDGGVIRATNGNNSYGTYGALATGNDPQETPKFATVNTRNQEAIVASAFAGEVNDEILTLEFTNAGQDYTQANYTIRGSGVSASLVQDEFRDNALFNVRIINEPASPPTLVVPDGSFVIGLDYRIIFPGDTEWTAIGAPDNEAGTEFTATGTGEEGGTGTAYYIPDLASAGGTGFIQVGNNAQAGNLTTITIATSDENEEANLLGARIIITSGTGTGQYGYVQAFDAVTKIVTVYRESDDQPGWDHVTPGWPLATVMDTSTTYRFEPRPVFSSPGFTPSAISLSAGTSWANVEWGETTENFGTLTAELGTGTVDTGDGLTKFGATFTVVKNGRDYSVTMVSGGAGYEVGDELVIAGTELGGQTPDNDLSIRVLSDSNDSTNSILTYEFSGIATSGRFVATASLGDTVSYSSDGTNWEVGTLPASGDWKVLGTGGNRFVAIQNNSNVAAYSLDGVTWTAATMPSTANWNDVAYGDGVFIAVADDTNSAAISKDGGVTWTTTAIPSFGDSTLNTWVGITYGKNRFVAVASSNNVAVVGTYDSDTETVSWDVNIMDIIDDSSQKDWIDIAYGNNRFVVLSSQADAGYSFDGITWYQTQMPSPDGSTTMVWTSLNYGQGLFFATCNTGGQTIGGDPTSGPTTYVGTSPDGITWAGENLNNTQNWIQSTAGNPDVQQGDSSLGNSEPQWIVITDNVTSQANSVITGATARGRCVVESGRITAVKLWNVGSGYTTEPTLTIIDPNNTSELFVQNRLGDGVLAQPSWLNRGVGYKTSTTVVTISGDGFADVIPTGKFVTVQGLSRYPGPGAQFVFDGNATTYTVVTITELGQATDETYSATVRLSPEIGIDDNLTHATRVTIRERYSQCRITGHDFLDIGTGNFEDTNYPDLYATGDFVGAPENEIFEADGGRVFYAATDQSGNFRCGELFAVEQATGIVTISADFFDLDGLSELALGGVRLGGSGAVIREFSTDPLFTADSNNVVPTQRAIKAYLQGRLSIGGSELSTASFVAGVVKVGPDGISSTIGGVTNFNESLKFDGTTDGVTGYTGSGQIDGAILAQNMFSASFDDDPNRLS